jgi:hypothetical protein
VASGAARLLARSSVIREAYLGVAAADQPALNSTAQKNAAARPTLIAGRSQAPPERMR